MIESFRRVLFLGAHPDDEIGCAGTITRLSRAGAAVTALTFSDCADVGEDLTGEHTRALDMLGVGRRVTYALPNRRLAEHRQVILDILDAIARGFDLVLAPSTTDAHQDHATVAAEAFRAFKRTTILGYELPINALAPMPAAGFVSLTPDLVDLKVRHAAAYRSQDCKPYMAEAFIRGLAAVRGVQSGVSAAEAFEVVRWVA